MGSEQSLATSPTTGPTENPSRTYQRIVVKAGTGLLTRGADRLDPQIMASLVDQIARLHLDGKELMLVSSGAVAAGRHALGLPREGRNLPLRQVLAAVGQSHLMHAYDGLFGDHGITVAQALLSRRDLSDRLGYLNVRNALLGLLERNVVPIINENDVVAVEELTGEIFGDNDTLSAMVANLVDADLLVMLGEVEGLYSSDPHVDPNARLIPTVERMDKGIEAIGGPPRDSVGRGGMATKLEAARRATASGVDVIIASGVERDVLTQLVQGKAIGTFFPATGTKIESRKRWMLSGVSTRGEILVDDGAAQALCSQNRSLLSAGVTAVLGSFERGDIVSILRTPREQIACGISNYSSEEVAKIKGVRSDRIAELLGHQYGDEVVHRNNMVVL